jgi:hypothetical protein
VYTFLITFTLILPRGIANHLVVNEVFYDTPGTESNQEWIEIYNPTSSAIDLTGYKIGDEETEGGTEGMYEFPYFKASIDPYSYFIICQYETTFIWMYPQKSRAEIFEFKDSDGDPSNDMVKYSSWASGSFSLNNDGDEVLLLDNLDDVVDVIVYEGGSYAGVIAHPGVAEGYSIERDPPGWDTEDCLFDMTEKEPGSESPGEGNTSPVIKDFWRGPFCPKSNEKGSITAVIGDDKGLQSKTVYYSINGGTYISISMTETAPDTFCGEIPEQTDGAHVRYYVEAVDTDNETVTSEIRAYFSGLTPIDSLRPNDTDGVPLYVGHAIRVTGLATVGSHTFETSTHIINLQNNGVGAVAKSASGSCPVVAPNDSLIVCGSISYWYGQTRIACPNSEDFDIKQVNKREPDIYVREYSDFGDYVGDNMDYEGLLVGLMNAEKNSGAWGSPGSSFGIWLQEVGASPPELVELWVDSDTDIDDNPEPSWPCDVVGVYSQYDNTSPYWSGYEIMPRSYADFDYDLPIQLTAFQAAVTICEILLSWKTACERNAYIYEIRRASNGSVGCDNAEVIGEVIAKGNSGTPQTYSFTDTQVNPGKIYHYWLIGVRTNGQRTIAGPVAAATGSAVMSVSAPYPNPFNRRTTFAISSASKTLVNVSVYDIIGRHIRTLFSSKNFKGKRTISLDGLDKNGKKLGEGVYFIRTQVGGSETTKKVILVR